MMSDLDEARAFLTVRDVATLLRCSKAHVHHLIAGRCGPSLPAIKLGRRTLVRRETLFSWLVAREAGSVVPGCRSLPTQRRQS
jgi:excisionase family DNA binding protein